MGGDRRTSPSGLIAVVRAASADECRTIVTGLVAAGLRTIEVTLTVPDALRVLEEVALVDAEVGAGTVLDAASCRSCIDAGAKFIVSPVTDLEVLEAARQAGVPFVGGALTPSEVLAAMRANVEAVKVFPIGLVGGPGYLRALREPLPGLRAVVSGGIGPGDVKAYWEAGASAVCMGGALIDRHAAAAGDISGVERKAREVLSTMHDDHRS